MIDDPRMLVVLDATLNPTFRGWANVTGAPNIRFYAGAPLIDEDGFVLGRSCVIDDRPSARRRPAARSVDDHGRTGHHLSAIRERVRRAALDDELLHAIEREENIVAASSHELRTPVTAIRGCLEMLTEKPALEPYRRLVDPIHRNGERLVRMIDHLLAGTRSADVPVTAGDDVVDLEAVVFSPPEGEVTVRVETGAHPCVQVTDCGVGIPADELPSVTRRFCRGRYAREQAVPGVGLGLHIAQRIATAHSGTVSVDSPGPGRGTTAQLRLRRGSWRVASLHQGRLRR
jgi:signal transduction histidine kinase